MSSARPWTAWARSSVSLARHPPRGPGRARSQAVGDAVADVAFNLLLRSSCSSSRRRKKACPSDVRAAICSWSARTVGDSSPRRRRKDGPTAERISTPHHPLRRGVRAFRRAPRDAPRAPAVHAVRRGQQTAPSKRSGRTGRIAERRRRTRWLSRTMSLTRSGVPASSSILLRLLPAARLLTRAASPPNDPPVLAVRRKPVQGAGSSGQFLRRMIR